MNLRVDVASFVELLSTQADEQPVTFVGLDGRSGAGKSTLAALVRTTLVARHGHSAVVTVIEGDQFYAGGTAAAWDARSAAVKSDTVIDWRRQREVLQSLRRDGRASWHGFDWESDDWDADPAPFTPRESTAVTAPIVLLEGAYGCRPELADVLDLRVLLEVRADIRWARLREREGEEYRADWAARWSSAEDHYFATVMPPSAFDVIVDGSPTR